MTVKILDRQSGAPVPFANLVLMRNGKQVRGWTSYEDGLVEVDALRLATDQLQVSSVGYKPILLSADSVPDLIELEPVTFALPEAVITPEKPAFPWKRVVLLACGAVLLAIIVILATSNQQ